MSFSFTNPRPDNDRSFSFTEHAEVEEKLQTIEDLAHEILRLIADVRRQTGTRNS